MKMFKMKLATCETVMGILPESTDSLKMSYLSRESTYCLVTVDFEVEEVRYALLVRIANKEKRARLVGALRFLAPGFARINGV